MGLACLNHFPLFAVMLRLKDPGRLPGGICFEIQDTASLLPDESAAPTSTPTAYVLLKVTLSMQTTIVPSSHILVSPIVSARNVPTLLRPRRSHTQALLLAKCFVMSSFRSIRPTYTPPQSIQSSVQYATGKESRYR